jgi:NADPH2:quinone reductase
MKAIVCKQFGTADSLTYEDLPSLRPGPGQLVISVKACGVNFPDTLIIQNKYQFKPELPFSPGGEVAGIVKSVGPDVSGFKPGDRVFALTRWGGFAEEVISSIENTWPLPETIDFITAGSTLYTLGTSYHALKDRANLQPGETLLVLGAAGGVGLAAVQLGTLMGATVIAAASSEEKLAACRQAGATATINYSTENLRERVKEITGGRGVDVVFDPVGDQYTEPALRSIAWKGRYLIVGFAAGEIPKIPMNLPLLKGCEIVGVFWGAFAKNERAGNTSNLKLLMNWLEENKLSNRIFKIYSLEESAAALKDVSERKVIGKAVVVMS